MKDNILNNSKNVGSNDIKYKPDGQMTKPVYDLMKNSRDGDFNKLKQLIDEKELDFQGSTLNLALRNLLSSFLVKKPNYFQCFKFLLSNNIDLNYKCPIDNNCTIFMKLAEMRLLILIKELLEGEYILKNAENNIFHKKEEEIEFEMTQKEIFFNQKDSNNNNFFHYLSYAAFNGANTIQVFNYLYYEYPFAKNEKNPKKIQDIFKKLLLEVNNEGNNFMNMCLLHGNQELVLQVIKILGFKQNINKKKNNYIHSAILGNNLNCLKIIMYYSSINDFNEKNNDNLTPAQLANKNGNIIMSNIINEYQNNCSEEGFKDIVHKNIDKILNENLSIDILINFKNNKYKQLIYELNELKIINNLCIEGFGNRPEDELNYKISNLKIEWNIILIKICESNYEKDSDNNSNNIINTNSSKPGKNNKKKPKKIDEKSKNTICPYLKSIQELNENYFSDKFILSFIDLSKDSSNLVINKNQNIDLLIYNKIIYYFKIGNFNSLINTADIYLTKIYYKNYSININFNNNRSLILYVNITCILIEIFIYQDYYAISEIFLKALDKFLYTKSLNFGDIIYTLDDKIIFDYLNKNELLNPFLSNWNELFNYSNLLKFLISKEKSKESIEDLRKKMDIDSYKKNEDIPILNRIQLLFSCIGIKKMYDRGDNNEVCPEVYTKLYELKNMGQDSEIYFLNIVGIIFLKNKKYNLSLMIFKKVLNKYILMLKNKGKRKLNYNEKFINFRIDYITALLYNISLCYFYLNEYNRCIKILELLLSFKNNKNNYFFYYRLGLCYFHIYIFLSKNNSDCYNKNILQLKGYEKNKNNNKKEKSISIDLDNDSTENLSYQLDLDFRENMVNKEIDDYRNLFSNDKKYHHNYFDSNCYNNNCGEKNIKRIILKNTTKNFINSDNKINNLNKNMLKNNLYNNEKISISMNSKNKSDLLKSDFLDKSIRCFKKVLIISKTNFYTESTKSIYNFYLLCIKDEIEEKDNIKNQKRKKIPTKLMFDTYLKLLLCLSLKSNWNEMIFITKDYNNKKLPSDKEMNLKLLLFKLEAYINLNNSSKIKEILNKLKSSKKKEIDVFNKGNNDIITKLNFKIYLYYTIILIFIKEKHYKEMDIYVEKLLPLINNEKNIPYYIIDLLINVFLIKLNNEPNLNAKNKFKYNNIILNLIKTKKTHKAD